MKHHNDPSPETIANRRAARALAIDQAMRGDPICGAYFALEALARSAPEGAFLVDFQDYEDETDEDDMRPY